MSDTKNEEGAARAPMISRFSKNFRCGALGALVLLIAPAAASANCEVPTVRLDPFVTENGRLPIVDRIVGDIRVSSTSM